MVFNHVLMVQLRNNFKIFIISFLVVQLPNILACILYTTFMYKTLMTAMYIQRMSSDCIYCLGAQSCIHSRISNVSSKVYCGGKESCKYTKMTDIHTIYCTGGYESCYNSTFESIENVYIYGGAGQTTARSRIYSKSGYNKNNITNIYLRAAYAGDELTIICNEYDTCNIECGVNKACDDSYSQQTNVICYGHCNVYCDESNGIACPQVTGNYTIYNISNNYNISYDNSSDNNSSTSGSIISTTSTLTTITTMTTSDFVRDTNKTSSINQSDETNTTLTSTLLAVTTSDFVTNTDTTSNTNQTGETSITDANITSSNTIATSHITTDHITGDTTSSYTTNSDTTNHPTTSNVTEGSMDLTDANGLSLICSGCRFQSLKWSLCFALLVFCFVLSRQCY